MMRFRPATALLAAALAVGACSPVVSDAELGGELHGGFVARHGERISGTGAVEWFTIEGGFFAIRGDDGKVYDPTNLPGAFAKDKLRVRFEARVRSDVAGFHAVGEIVELARISGA